MTTKIMTNYKQIVSLLPYHINNLLVEENVLHGMIKHQIKQPGIQIEDVISFSSRYKYVPLPLHIGG